MSSIGNKAVLLHRKHSNVDATVQESGAPTTDLRPEKDKNSCAWQGCESGVYGKVTQPPEGEINKTPTQTGGGKR